MKTQKENDSDVFKVYARIRPLFDRELQESFNKNIISSCISSNKDTVYIFIK